MTRAIVVIALAAAVVPRAALAQPPVAPPPISDEAAIKKALEADAARNAPAPPPPPPAAAPGSETPATLSAQAGARPAGTGLLNPNISVIVDGSFGYYGVHSADFPGIGIPASGDDPG